MWTYLEYDADGEPSYSEDQLPPEGSGFLAFDALRWKIQIGFREDGGFMSLLIPNVNDDCNIVAWAPLGETEGPDFERFKTTCPWTGAANENYAGNGIQLIR